MTDIVTPFLEATIRTATPLALAALGESIAERAGVINVGLEGVIICGCLGAVVGAQGGGVAGGMLSGMAAGVGAALVFALFVVWLRADQIITGTAVTLGALGLTAALYRATFGTTGAALHAATMGPVPVPVLSDIPVFGPALFRQPPITYALYFLTLATWWFLYRTHAGLGLRAVGENPEAARAAGINATRVQGGAVLAAGALGGLAGATLVLAQVGTFTEGMSAGRGFIAIAIVALGRWHPLGVALAALVFGGASALQFLLQSTGTQLPYQLFLAFPYVLTLVVLASGTSGVRPPAALGQRELGSS